MTCRPDIASRYTLLLAHTHSIMYDLVPPPTAAVAGKEADRIWRKSLANTVVHAGQPINRESDFIVGMLLTTKQVCKIQTLVLRTWTGDLLLPLRMPRWILKLLRSFQHCPYLCVQRRSCPRIQPGHSSRIHLTPIDNCRV